MLDIKAIKRQIKPYVIGFPMILICVLISLVIANRYLKYAHPVYESVVKLRIADVNEGPSSANLYKDFDVFTQNNKILAETELIKSKIIIEKALTKIDIATSYYRIGNIRTNEIYNETPFHVIVKNGSKKIYNAKIHLKITDKNSFELYTEGTPENIQEGIFNTPIEYKNAIIEIKRNDSILNSRKNMEFEGDYLFCIHSKDYIIEHLIADNLDVVPVDKEVPVVRISYKSQVPQKSADFANALAEAYIEDYINNRQKEASVTLEFIENQMQQASQELSSSENAIENYRDDRHIINTRQETETDLRKIAQQKIDLANIEASLAAIEDLENYMENGKNNSLELAPNFEAFTDLLSTELVKKIKALQSEKKDLLLRYTEENPKVLIVDKKIEDITSYLLESIRNSKRNIKIKRDNLTLSIQVAEHKFDGIATKEKNMTILERDFTHSQNLFNFLTEKKTEAGIAQSANIAFHRIISRAEVPKNPINLKNNFIYVLAIFVGLLIGLSIIFLKDTLYKKLELDDIKDQELNYLNSVQVNRISETFTSLMLLPEIETKKRICFTSLENKTGKTFITLNIASMLVLSGKKVCILDLNFSNPTVQKFLKSNSTENSNKDFTPNKDEKSGIYFIPIAGYNLNPSIYFNTSDFQNLVEKLSTEFDYILFDTASFNKNSEVLHLLKIADINIAIFSESILYTEIEEIKALQKKNISKNIFVLLNYSKMKKTWYKPIQNYINSKRK